MAFRRWAGKREIKVDPAHPEGMHESQATVSARTLGAKRRNGSSCGTRC